MNHDQPNREKAEENENKAPDASPSSSRSSPVRHNFPDKLHYVLNEMTKDGLDHIMSWQPHGRCFVVHDQKRLEQHILPTWFRQSRFSSFQRQLNIYGFTRIPKGPDKGGYYHKCFLRGQPEQAQKIPRQKFKGTGARKASSEDDVPNFYNMSPLPPPAEARSDTASSPALETTEVRDPAPPHPRSCYDLSPTNHRMPQTSMYTPTMSRHAVPDMITVSDGTKNYDLLPQNNRVWVNPSPSQQPSYFGYYNMQQQQRAAAALQPSLCRRYGK